MLLQVFFIWYILFAIFQYFGSSEKENLKLSNIVNVSYALSVKEKFRLISASQHCTLDGLHF